MPCTIQQNVDAFANTIPFVFRNLFYINYQLGLGDQVCGPIGHLVPRIAGQNDRNRLGTLDYSKPSTTQNS